MRRMIRCLVLLTMFAQGHAQSCDFSAAETSFANFIQQQQLSGGGLMVGGRLGVYRERYFGSYDANTVELIASASKLLAGTRLLQLYDQQRLDLDQPVGEILPSFTGSKAAMTVRQMFAHSAGYGDDSANAILLNPNLTLAQAVDQIACCRDLNPGYSVGGQFSYGGVSMHIAGRIAEVRGGGDWNERWRLNLGLPLGATSITWANGSGSTNYGIAGTARSNMRDYGKVLQMLTNYGRAPGKTLLKPSTVDILQRDAAAGLPIAYAPNNVPLPVRYSFGAWLHGTRPATQAPLLHSLGAFGFLPWIDFKRQSWGILMLRGNAGINSQGVPVYFQILSQIDDVLQNQSCALLEPNDDLLIDGME